MPIRLALEAYVRNLTPQALVAMILVLVVTPALLGSGVVLGVVSADGTFHLDHNAVHENATLMDGSVIESDRTDPRLRLKDGAWVHFGSGSRARISGHTVELESGAGEIGHAAGYEVEAKTLRIRPAAQSVVRVQVENEHRVVVAAYDAPARIYNQGGLLVTSLVAGSSLSFDPRADDASAANLSGCLLVKASRYIVVYDPANHQYAELQGVGDMANLGKEVGNRVNIKGAVSGTPNVAGASQLVRVSSVTRVALGGCVAVASDVQADTPTVGGHGAGPAVAGGAAAGAAAGVAVAASHTLVYVLVGVAVAGGAAGAVLATKKSSTSGQ